MKKKFSVADFGSTFKNLNMDSSSCSSTSEESTKTCRGVFTVKNDRGLHTRPSTEIIKCATNYRADVTLIFEKNNVNAKSLLGILMLAASKGSKIQVEAVGEDAEEAVKMLIALAENNFNIKY